MPEARDGRRVPVAADAPFRRNRAVADRRHNAYQPGAHHGLLRRSSRRAHAGHRHRHCLGGIGGGGSPRIRSRVAVDSPHQEQSSRALPTSNPDVDLGGDVHSLVVLGQPLLPGHGRGDGSHGTDRRAGQHRGRHVRGPSRRDDAGPGHERRPAGVTGRSRPRTTARRFPLCTVRDGGRYRRPPGDNHDSLAGGGPYAPARAPGNAASGFKRRLSRRDHRARRWNAGGR
jgi:hypothetical protein